MYTFGFGVRFAHFITTTAWSGMLTNGKGAGFIGALLAAGVQVAMLLCGLSGWAAASLAFGTLPVGLLAVPVGEAYLLATRGPQRRHNDDVVTHDFNSTNWDEFHGQLLAGVSAFLVAAEYPGDWPRIWLSLFMSFVVFRVCDVWKPGPIGYVERKYSGTGYGIMIDDTLAGACGFAMGLIALGF